MTLRTRLAYLEKAVARLPTPPPPPEPELSAEEMTTALLEFLNGEPLRRFLAGEPAATTIPHFGTHQETCPSGYVMTFHEEGNRTAWRWLLTYLAEQQTAFEETPRVDGVPDRDLPNDRDQLSALAATLGVEIGEENEF